MAAAIGASCLCGASVRAQPASWLPDIAQSDKLYTADDTRVSAQNHPEIGNGFLATQLMDDSVYVSGLYNGYLTADPSHRARIPATNAVAAPGITCDAAIDLRQATYYRRSYIDPLPPGSRCLPNATAVSCSNAGSRVYVEQRWFAHRRLPSVMVMEVEVLTADQATADYWRGDSGAPLPLVPPASWLDSSADLHYDLPPAQGGPADQGVLPFAVLLLQNNPGAPSTDINLTTIYSAAAPSLAGGSPVFLGSEPGSDASSYTIRNGSTLVAESNSSSVQALAVLTTDFPPRGLLSVSAPGVTYAFLTVIRTSVETRPEDLVAAVQGDYAVAVALQANGTLHSSHVLEWQQTVWTSGVETDRPDLARAANSSLYAILSSVRSDRPLGIGPGGLTSAYNGHMFWDQETWMFPSLLLLHPDLAAALLQYRVARIPGAQTKAASYDPPYLGACFPWESALTGLETCPSWAPTGVRELHINGDIAYAVWQFWRVTQDRAAASPSMAWLEQVAYPLLSGIATFWLSKIVQDTPGCSIDGYPFPYPEPPNPGSGGSMPLHINNVIPPDEYHDHVNDSAYTNAVARLTLTYAAAAAQLLQRPPSEYAAWANASTRVVVPFNATVDVPGFEGGVHPEYDGYYNDTIKQADAVLLGFPLSVDFAGMTPQVRRNDLLWYSKVTDPQGPAMSWAMFSIGFVELNEMDTAAAYFNSSFTNAQAPFDVWTETPDGGAPNFLTGAGGFLQGVLFGYPQLRINDTHLTFSQPALFEGSSFVKIRGLSYLGNRLDIEYTASRATITVQAPTQAQTAFEAPSTHRYAMPGSAPSDAPLRSENAKESIRAAQDRGVLLGFEPVQARTQNGRVWVPAAALDGETEDPTVLRAPAVHGEGAVIGQTSLVLVDGEGTAFPLAPGVPVQVSLPQVFSITALA
jgi:hypothetical protein